MSRFRCDKRSARDQSKGQQQPCHDSQRYSVAVQESLWYGYMEAARHPGRAMLFTNQQNPLSNTTAEVPRAQMLMTIMMKSMTISASQK